MEMRKEYTSLRINKVRFEHVPNDDHYLIDETIIEGDWWQYAEVYPILELIKAASPIALSFHIKQLINAFYAAVIDKFEEDHKLNFENLEDYSRNQIRLDLAYEHTRKQFTVKLQYWRDREE